MDLVSDDIIFLLYTLRTISYKEISGTWFTSAPLPYYMKLTEQMYLSMCPDGYEWMYKDPWWAR